MSWNTVSSAGPPDETVRWERPEYRIFRLVWGERRIYCSPDASPGNAPAFISLIRKLEMPDRPSPGAKPGTYGAQGLRGDWAPVACSTVGTINERDVQFVPINPDRRISCGWIPEAAMPHMPFVPARWLVDVLYSDERQGRGMHDVEAAVRAIVMFRKRAMEWIKANQELKRTSHESCYWLPMLRRQDKVGLPDYLFRFRRSNILALRAVAASWHKLPDCSRVPPWRVIREHADCIVDEYAAKHKLLAAQAHVAGIEPEEYKAKNYYRYTDRSGMTSVIEVGDNEFRGLPLDANGEPLEVNRDPAVDDGTPVVATTNYLPGPVESDNFETMEERWAKSLSVPQAFPDIRIEAGGCVGRFLERSDPRGLFLGSLTNCCQYPTSTAESSAWHGQEDPCGGFFVVEKAGKILAQSWAWKYNTSNSPPPGPMEPTRTIACFDSIESLERPLKPNHAEVVGRIYKAAAEAMVDAGFDKVFVSNDSSLDMKPWALMEYVGSLDYAIAPRGVYSDAKDPSQQFVLAASPHARAEYPPSPPWGRMSIHNLVLSIRYFLLWRMYGKLEKIHVGRTKVRAFDSDITRWF